MKKKNKKKLDIKEIRKKLVFFKKKLSSRNDSYDLDKLILLDKNNRELIQKKESLEQEKKIISKSKDIKNFEKSKKLSDAIDDIEIKQKVSQKNLNSILINLPNTPLDEIPIGKDENFNIEILKSGKINNFDFKLKSHIELGESLNMLDFDLATKTTGSRFVFVKDKLALLERAISNFMLDTHVNINGYYEVSPPLMASESSMFGTGQLPKFENDQYEILLDDKTSNERKFLIPYCRSYFNKYGER